MDRQPLAIVTGAAHRLGKAFALTLARRGYAILLHYFQAEDEAVATLKEIQRHDVPVSMLQSDLTTEDGISNLVSALDSWIRLDTLVLKVLVNSAAIMPRSDLRSVSSEEWDTTFALNLRVPFSLTQQAADRMKEGGLIVNITDIGAHKLWTMYPAYVVSKAAVEMLTRLQAKTYAPGIRVNVIAPGLVIPSNNTTPEEWEKLVERLPLRRPAAPDEITGALEFLLDTPSVTGQTITVDGGYSLLS